MKMVDIVEFRRAIGEFNDGHYFECHDTLEALWLLASGEEKRFLQGLIQVSVGFYHFSNGNPSGAISQWGKGSRKLETFGPGYAGLDHAGLLASVAEWVGIASRVLCGEKVLTENVKTPILQFNLNS